MGEKVDTLVKIARSLCLSGLLFGIFACANAEAAAIATAGQDDGYSGRILDKIAAKWRPPKQLVGTHRLKLILSVDSDGELIDCKVQKGSGLDALDVSACAAARAAAPFGPPPYGMPASVHFSFWTGGLDSRVPVHDEKEKANTIYAERAAEDARFANERAQARAQAAAKSAGKQLPGEKSVDTTGKSGGKAPTASAVAKEAPPVSTAANAAIAQADKAGGKYPYSTRERYLSKITWDLRNAMFVPIQTKPGTYYATVRVECDKAGNITSSNMLKGSGDALLDKYVMQGIERSKKIVPPAEEFGNSFDLTFKIIRQAKARKKATPAPTQQDKKLESPDQGGDNNS